VRNLRARYLAKVGDDSTIIKDWNYDNYLETWHVSPFPKVASFIADDKLMKRKYVEALLKYNNENEITRILDIQIPTGAQSFDQCLIYLERHQYAGAYLKFEEDCQSDLSNMGKDDKESIKRLYGDVLGFFEKFPNKDVLLDTLISRAITPQCQGEDRLKYLSIINSFAFTPRQRGKCDGIFYEDENSEIKSEIIDAYRGGRLKLAEPNKNSDDYIKKITVSNDGRILYNSSDDEKGVLTDYKLGFLEAVYIKNPTLYDNWLAYKIVQKESADKTEVADVCRDAVKGCLEYIKAGTPNAIDDAYSFSRIPLNFWSDDCNYNDLVSEELIGEIVLAQHDEKKVKSQWKKIKKKAKSYKIDFASFVADERNTFCQTCINELKFK